MKRTLPSFGLAFLTLAACGGAKTPDGLPALDCSSEISYQGVKTGGGLEVLGVGNGKASYEDTAIRQINDQVASYVAVQTRLCRDYNAGVVSRQEYNTAAAKIRETMTASASAAAKYASATTDDARKVALDGLLRLSVPEAARPQELELSVTVDVELPASAGGSKIVLRPGAPLPTNARVAFQLLASKAAHVYLFQKKPSGAIAVLFPDPRAGAQNPLGAGASVRIPKGDLRYRVNDEDLGLESVYLVASRSPLPALDRAAEDVASGKAQNVGNSPVLASFGTVAVGATPPGCSKARALELEGGPAPTCTRSRGLELEGEATTASMSVRTDPGDDTIVKVLAFEHVREAAYPAAQKAFEARAGH